MRTRRTFDHDAALSRRLAQLGDELSADRWGVRSARPEPPTTDLTTAPWWDEHTRPAAPRRPPAPPPPVPRPLPTASRPPAPGRHALRSSRGPAGLGAAQLAVVAVVVAVGLAVTCWWLVRGSAHDAPALAAARTPGLISISPAVEPVGDVPSAGAIHRSGSGDRHRRRRRQGAAPGHRRARRRRAGGRRARGGGRRASRSRPDRAQPRPSPRRRRAGGGRRPGALGCGRGRLASRRRPERVR